MKKLLLAFGLFFALNSIYAQLNVTFKSQVQYGESLNDIWGWANPVDGREYALVGMRNGVNIVDVTDSENPVDLGTAPGPSSTWRDIKTYAGFAYVTNETGQGILVINLQNLPAQITAADYYYWAPNIPNLGTLSSIHNIYIDEYGYAYLAGSNLNNGGMVILDVYSTPGTPQFEAVAPPVYAHDVYARDNKMYASEIYGGEFAIYNVANKESIELLGSQSTAFNFTHNAWLSDDGNTLFTTDEKANAPIGSYDVTNPANIEELDQFRPASTLGDGVIPHNVHVWNDWIIVSYYTDGCIIIDGSRPSNLVEVGNFDTYIPASTGFSGAWGAYPFLPSQTILVADIGNGLYVLEPDYVRACWLEGKVTDAATGNPLEGVDIVIDSAIEDNFENSNGFGEYGTGLATNGTYMVTFTKPNYFPVSAEAVLVNGEVTILDVQMETSVTTYTLSGQVIDTEGNPVPQALINMIGFDVDETVVANENGNFNISTFGGNYEVFVGAWGYVNIREILTLENNAQPTYVIEKGYADDFVLDYGWESTGNASTGLWEIGVPNGTTYQGSQSNPGSDVSFDIGQKCYVTGNGGGGAGDDDVDDGNVVLTSPVMDLTDYVFVEFTYNRWFFNSGGSGSPNDNLIVKVTNGVQEEVLETITASNPTWGSPVTYTVDPNFFTLNNNVRIVFETADGANSGHLVEAGLDRLLVTGTIVTSTTDFDENLSVKVYPNPFNNQINLDYNFDANYDNCFVHVYNILGQRMESVALNNNTGSIALGKQLDTGIYFIQIETDNSVGKAIKAIKN